VPYNLDYSFTCGWVSAKGRSNLTNTTFEDYIQTDAFINPGNSGGPLFDVEGRVIGMNTLINGIGRGLAFAIPSNMLREVSAQIIKDGKVVRPWLGIRIQTLRDNPTLCEQLPEISDGVVIDTIEPNAPAYKSDLRPADVITHIDEHPLATARDLQKQVLTKKVGQKVMLTVWRGGRTLKIPITTGKLPSLQPKQAKKDAPPAQMPGSERPNLGLHLQDITPELVKSLGLKVDSGALIAALDENSIADRAKLRRNDVITEVDQQPVTGTASFQQKISGQKLKKGVLLFVDRKGRKTYAILKTE
jgi:S1-C subfamily serine protease